MYLSKLSPRDMVVLSLLILCAVIFAGYMIVHADRSGDIINVEVQDGVAKEVVFKRLDLAPGQSCAYTLILEREEDIAYDVTFDFEETEPLELKKYVHVKMEVDGKVFCDKLLADVFEENAFHLYVDPAKKGSDDIKITYYLPEDVGNEAQKAKSVFTLLVTATSQSSVEGEEE